MESKKYIHTHHHEKIGQNTTGGKQDAHQIKGVVVTQFSISSLSRDTFTPAAKAEEVQAQNNASHKEDQANNNNHNQDDIRCSVDFVVGAGSHADKILSGS